jgi:hypothetical protein
MATSGKYLDLWAKQRENIKSKMKNANSVQIIQFSESEFSKVGNRKSYSFNLEFNNGIVSNNISGSAVARDLAETLEGSKEIREILKNGYFKFNLNNSFCLRIQKI